MALRGEAGFAGPCAHLLHLLVLPHLCAAGQPLSDPSSDSISGDSNSGQKLPARNLIAVGFGWFRLGCACGAPRAAAADHGANMPLGGDRGGGGGGGSADGLGKDCYFLDVLVGLFPPNLPCTHREIPGLIERVSATLQAGHADGACTAPAAGEFIQVACRDGVSRYDYR
eukprot:SAG31_NODE_73_length_27793_cov_26.900520_19_plen_170_part_00